MVKEYRADPMNGTVIEGRYEVRRRLARGGMSTVYLAVDLRLDREVALKVLYPHLAENPELVERFEQEAKTAARLSHPHVVNVLDQGVDEHPDGDLAYLVMEYVPGYTLRTVLQRRHALAPRVALAYLEAMVDGLAAAHSAGLVHRDMKPENVLVSRDGRIKVADFGLARATTNFTGTGAALVGTVAYISPELVSGSAADERSDVYAVGIMAYEMLTGDQPFTGASPIQVAYQHLNREVPAPSEATPGLAAELDHLVLWSTAQQARDRPADASVLLAEIRALRSSLSDEDLDLETTPAPDAGGATEVLSTARGRDTVVWDGDGDDDGHDVDDNDDLDPADAGAATEVVDAGATTVLPTGGHQHTHQHTTVLPRPAGGAAFAGATGEDAAGTGTEGRGRLIPQASSGGQRDASSRQRRRQAARRAKTPTEDLGRQNGQRMWWWAAVVVIITALLVLAGWFFGTGPGGMVTVPEIEGHSRASAVSALEQTGVGYALSSVHHDVVAGDRVISTEPAGGTEVRRFTTVLVTVSLGPELFTVPDVSGLDRSRAESELREHRLTLGDVTTEYSDAVPEGSVLSQSPAPGEALRLGRPVDVVLSDGPEPVTVPEVTGMTLEEATAELESAGLRVEVREVLGGLFGGRGQVLDQSPEPGTETAPGSTVTIDAL
ncbi:protein kinase domain-containing protein [Citricoccus nitrophenolicus]|uniref:protein kinase domain-containing protein n=1 Tax=Citricoccus nitrophenolicus TaxID=863575 RepID=UPI003D769CE0